LRFANVLAHDALSDEQPYLCVLSNDLLRSLVQGEDQRIAPQSVRCRCHERLMHAELTSLQLARVTPTNNTC